MSKSKKKRIVSSSRARTDVKRRPLSVETAVLLPELDWRFVLIAGVCVTMLAFVTHIITVNGGLVFNDRYNLAFLFDKQTLQLLSEQIVSDLFAKPLTQPWLKASLITDCGDYGNNYMWYHAVNILLHVAASGYFFAFLVRLCRILSAQGRLNVNPYYVAASAAALFACHPFTCEAVAYLSSRSALLGTVNYLLALNLFLLGFLAKNPFLRYGGYLFCLITACMSVWSNPESISLPTTMLVLVLLISKPFKLWRQTVKEHPYLIVLLFALALSVPLLKLLGIEYSQSIKFCQPVLGWESYLASALKALPFYYLPGMLIPIGLSIDPPFVVAASFADPLAIGGVLFVVVGLYLLYRARNSDFLFFAGFFILLGFIPHILLVQKDTVADWVAYLPLAGFSMLFGFAISVLSQKKFVFALSLFSFVIVLCFALSCWRDTQWSANAKLGQSALVWRPKSALAHALLVEPLLLSHRLEQASEQARLAVTYDPNLSCAWLAQGYAAIAQNKFSLAQKAFANVRDIVKRQALPQVLADEAELGEVECLVRQNKFSEADPLLIQIAKRQPAKARILYIVGLECLQKKDYGQGFRFFDAALREDPSAGASLEPAVICALETKMYKEAYVLAGLLKERFDSAVARGLYAKSKEMLK
jgi:tetratricopeptide (TPR) repeat protein